VIGKLSSLLRIVLNFIKVRPIISSIAGIAVVVTVILVSTGGGGSPYDFITVEGGSLVQEVNVTGQVKATENANLSFEQSGIIAQVPADVGDEVTAGQTLVTLRNSDLVALFNQAEAQVDVEIATLNNLKSDSQQDLQGSYEDALNTIKDALAKSEDAVRSKTVGLFSGSATTGYNLTFSTCSFGISDNAKTLRLEVELGLDQWNKGVSNLGVSPSNTEIDVALVIAKQNLNLVERFVNATNEALLTKCATENSRLDAGRTNMATAQTNVSAAVDNVNNASQAIALDKISNDDVETQEAKIRAAQASADNYRAQLEKTIIRSPINGVVTKQNARVGEAVSVNTPIVSVISASNFEIEAFIPEADTSKVQVGNEANVTLDAYGRDVIFKVTVSAIDLGETIIEGVTTYKTTFQFIEDDKRIKSGMTANVDILTAMKANVLAVPQRAVITRDGQKFVRLLNSEGGIEEVVVEVGLRGSAGNIEITSGLNVGDKVVTFVREEG